MMLGKSSAGLPTNLNNGRTRPTAEEGRLDISSVAPPPSLSLSLSLSLWDKARDRLKCCPKGPFNQHLTTINTRKIEKNATDRHVAPFSVRHMYIALLDGEPEKN